MLNSSGRVAYFEGFETNVHALRTETQFRSGAAKFRVLLLLCKSSGTLRRMPRLSEAMETGKTEGIPGKTEGLPAECKRDGNGLSEERFLDLRSPGRRGGCG